MNFKVLIILLGLVDLEGGASDQNRKEPTELTNDNFNQLVSEKAHFVMFYSKR